MVHGRNSYKRSAALSQFIMHRGLIISTMQVSCSGATVEEGLVQLSLPPLYDANRVKGSCLAETVDFSLVRSMVPNRDPMDPQGSTDFGGP